MRLALADDEWRVRMTDAEIGHDAREPTRGERVRVILRISGILIAVQLPSSLRMAGILRATNLEETA